MDIDAEVIAAYERMRHKQVQLGLRMPQNEVIDLASSALQDACAILGGLLLIMDQRQIWHIESRFSELRALMNDPEALGTFLGAEIALLHQAGLSVNSAFATISGCLTELTETDDPEPLAPDEWRALYMKLAEQTCRLSGRSPLAFQPKPRAMRRVLGWAIEAAGASIVIILNVGSVAVITTGTAGVGAEMAFALSGSLGERGWSALKHRLRGRN